MTTKSVKKFAPEVRERAIRLVLKHKAEHPLSWAAIESIVPKIGCTAETLRGWMPSRTRYVRGPDNVRARPGQGARSKMHAKR